MISLKSKSWQIDNVETVLFDKDGTFIDLQHDLAHTMKLCVKNKVNLTDFYYEQLFTFADKARDPRDRVLSVAYMLLTNSEENLTNGEWFDINLEEVECNTKILENGGGINSKLS